MKEHEIIMSEPMVRAILEDRKTQTRQIVKPQPRTDYEIQWLCPEHGDHKAGRFCIASKSVWAEYPQHHVPITTPYVAGDRLWLKERHRFTGRDEGRSRLEVEYADGERRWISVGREEYCKYTENQWGTYARWRPLIGMPRWASRITLEITKVRVKLEQNNWVWVIDFKRA
jgi:hypothetical protein